MIMDMAEGIHGLIMFSDLELRNNNTQDGMRALYKAKKTQMIMGMDSNFERDLSDILERYKDE
jgi:hypothetical protein